jgi:hypothetical protein
MANGLFDGWDAGQSAYGHAEPGPEPGREATAVPGAEPAPADPAGRRGAPPEVLRGEGDA